MSWLYLASVIGAGFCMGLVDHRWRLFAFRNARRAAIVLLAGFIFFLVWDLVALEIGVYGRGESPAMTGIELAPHLPLEELFFIVFLTYVTGVLHGLFTLLLRQRESVRR
ncbi:lycopene cyclase domain-containing protein [Aeromicrobium duanguangcaii]|uniref:Lycopene cyclase domain-containing protein n=1 Tax=Aeromicrobium duanguangcaii TaxID=2968086 RepID=A0ABY5KFE8_9ACTN|nr:lycopene cyclase domain-containing protein [Aeromicrobium duanguangcaii]MCD9154375.1 lycopene cyclase domain-containing protein [Aeromicrobium duanguangcaii]UUI68559.1 lycopene cyclase domain-containing protein [Aeromicrobium duanguangcaii]